MGSRPQPVDGELGIGARVARWVLSSLVVAFATGISAGAAWISWHSIGDLAIRFDWPRETAWLVMPLLEGFLLLGTAEAALRALDGEKAYGPKACGYSALVATLACNVASHVLKLHDASPWVSQWRLLILGAFAALIPLAQIGALHMATGRLARIARRRGRGIAPTPAVPGVLSRITRAAADRVTAAIEQPRPPARPSTSSPAHTSAPVRAGGRKTSRGRRSGPGPVELMRQYWDAQVAQGRIPTEAEMDRAAGVTYRLAKKYRPKWLAALEAGGLDAELEQLEQAPNEPAT